MLSSVMLEAKIFDNPKLIKIQRAVHKICPERKAKPGKVDEGDSFLNFK